MDQGKGVKGYIYRTFSPASGQFYIGRRHGDFDPTYFGSGVRITRWIRKYGKSSLVVDALEWANDAKTLDDLERYYIKTYREFGFDLMNIADGGQGSSKGTIRPRWVVEKVRLANIGVSRTVSAEARAKAAAKNRGRKRSPDVRLKMSIARKAVGPPSAEARAKMRAARIGRKFGPIPEETRKRMSEAQKGRKKTPEQVAKTVAAIKARWSKTPKASPTAEHRDKIRRALLEYFSKKRLETKPNDEKNYTK